jgi:hypothetical protein
MSNFSLSSFSDFSTIAASIAAIWALYVSSRQFRLTQKSTRETQAVELLLKFNQLNIDQQKLAIELVNNPTVDKQLTNAAVRANTDLWYGNCKMAITEALFEISHQSPAWRSTMRWMLHMQKRFVQEGGFECETFSSEFRAFCKSEGLELRSSA